MSEGLSVEERQRALNLMTTDAQRMELLNSLDDGSISPAAARLALDFIDGYMPDEPELPGVLRGAVFLMAASYYTREWSERARRAVETRRRNAKTKRGA